MSDPALAQQGAARRLHDRLAAELAEPVHPEAAAFAAHLATEGGPAVAAVLFYGSGLRAPTDRPIDGLLDFYVLTETPAALARGPLRRLASRRLPPDVEYRELSHAGRTLRAKVATTSLGQFAEAAAGQGADTTVWARFSQPARLVYAHDSAAREAAVAAVAASVQTATVFAALLGPDEAEPAAYWRALYAATYAADLRIERQGRETAILAFAGDGGDDRWSALLPDAWTAAAVPFTRADPTLRPQLPPERRASIASAWARQRRWAKPLNLARLAKAAFTFTGAAPYAAWKIERHTGVALHLKPWQQRHPILAAPGVAWRLWRAGVLR